MKEILTLVLGGDESLEIGEGFLIGKLETTTGLAKVIQKYDSINKDNTETIIEAPMDGDVKIPYIKTFQKKRIVIFPCDALGNKVGNFNVIEFPENNIRRANVSTSMAHSINLGITN